MPGARQPSRPLPVYDLNADRDRRLPTLSRHSPATRFGQGIGWRGLINGSPKIGTADTTGMAFCAAYRQRWPSLAKAFPCHCLWPWSAGHLARRHGRSGRWAAWPAGHRLGIGDYRLPVQPNGELLLHYGRASSHYYPSAADVLAGCIHRLVLLAFVLIGFNSTGAPGPHHHAAW